MCFSIPTKVLRVEKRVAFVEGGKKVQLGDDREVQKGDYIQVVGDVAVGMLTKHEGLKMRQLIKRLNN